MIAGNIKIVILLSHHPDPRMIRRAKTLLKIADDLAMVFWERTFNTSIPQEIWVKAIKISDPWNWFGRILVDLKLFFISFDYLLTKGPTIIYISGFDMLPSGYFYKIFHPRVKLILEVPDLPGGRFSKGKMIKYINNLINKAIRRVDLLVLTSPYFWDEYYKNVFPYPERVFIMENLPPQKLFKNFRPGKHKKLTIGFVGSIRYAKQIEMLFESCKEYKDKVRIIVAGSGPDYEYIKRISKNYSNVEVTGPYDYEKDILNIYSKIDIVYSVYDADLHNVRVAIPNRLYEAIVCGLPIIVAKNTALSILVKKYGVGFEVSHNEINDLKALIGKIVEDPSLLGSYRENALKIRDNFYYENVEKEFIKKVTKMVEEVINKNETSI